MNQAPDTRKSQTDQVKMWLLMGNTLTTLEAINRWKITRLSGRIFDIRQLGVNVQDRWIETQGGAKVKQYYVDPDNRFINHTNGHKKPVSLKELADRITDEVPTSRLDSLLTGPNAVLGKPPWGCSDIERLLRAIKKRQIDVANQVLKS